MKGTVRKRRYPSGVVKWLADCGVVDGKRLMTVFKTREEAFNHLKKTKVNIREQGTDSVTLSARDRLLFIAWQERFAEVGADIESAGSFFLKHHGSVRKAECVNNLASEYLSSLARMKRNARHIQETRVLLIRFLTSVEIASIDEIKREHVQEWVTESYPDGAHRKPRTQTNRLASIRGFLNWAVSENYLLESPLDGRAKRIRLPKPDSSMPQCFGLPEIMRLLHVALFGVRIARNPQTNKNTEVSYHELIGYLTAALFLGIRPEEIAESKIEHLDLRGRTFLVTDQASKTSKTRVIELSRVAVIWFRLWKRLCPEQEAFTGPNFRRRWDSFRDAADVGRWVPDGLRHTFASMHYAAFQNAATLKAMLGHSQNEETLFHHYRAVKTVNGDTITKRIAKQFWELSPKVIRQSTKMDGEE